MPEHDYFKELSSLAVTGDLSPTEFAELRLHLAQCSSCQAVYLEFTELANHHLAFADQRTGRAPAPETVGFRDAVLRRAAEEGFRISPEALRGPEGIKTRLMRGLEDLRWAIRARTVPLGISAVLLGGTLMAGLVVRHDAGRQHEIEKLRADVSRAKANAGGPQETPRPVGPTEARPAMDVERMLRQLSDASAQLVRLRVEHERDLTAIEGLQARIDELTSQNNTMAQRTTDSDANLAAFRRQMDELRGLMAEKEARLAASEFQVAELSNQLKGQESALEREQQLLAAGRDIRDVVSARDLHIIDVHDLDAHGESRPFGRIFLTEGKRLIFYAYDLDAVKLKNASFQAWGQGVDGNRGAVSLGLMYVDDQKQSRWTLKVEDPSLLKAIDSVFVTVEPHGGTTKPTGKKLMYAYLRNPINHP